MINLETCSNIWQLLTKLHLQVFKYKHDEHWELRDVKQTNALNDKGVNCPALTDAALRP